MNISSTLLPCYLLGLPPSYRQNQLFLESCLSLETATQLLRPTTLRVILDASLLHLTSGPSANSIISMFTSTQDLSTSLYLHCPRPHRNPCSRSNLLSFLICICARAFPWFPHFYLYHFVPWLFRTLLLSRLEHASPLCESSYTPYLTQSQSQSENHGSLFTL